MKFSRPHLLLILLCLMASGNLWADPENFLVSEFTFVRPLAWEWVPLETTGRQAQLKIFDSEKKQSADVVFYLFALGDKLGDPDDSVRRWKMQFQEKDTIHPKIERRTINKHKVTYVQMEGTYKGFGKERLVLPNHILLGTLIETSKGNILIRMTGPKILIEKSVAELKKMVENALQGE